MILVFDTSILIDIENRNKDVILKIKEMSKLYTTPAMITFINYFEVFHGITNKSPSKKEKAEAFLEIFNMMQPTKQTARILSKLKEKYDKIGKPISLTDFIIAAQVIENDALLLTRDRDFEKIEEMNKVII